MTDTRAPETPGAGLDAPPSDLLVRARRLFTRALVSAFIRGDALAHHPGADPWALRDEIVATRPGDTAMLLTGGDH